MNTLTSPNKANKEIRDALDAHKMKQWQLADLLGISEFTLTRWLRKELTEQQKEIIMTAIKNAN